MFKRLIHKVTGHKEAYLDRGREYNVWDGYFETGVSKYRIPVVDQWHIRCSCGKCMRHHFNETETTVEAESLPEVWAKIGGGPLELLEYYDYPDFYPEEAQGILQGFTVELDKLGKVGIQIPDELQN